MTDTPDPELLAVLRLHLVTGVGPRTQVALRERFGSAQQALRATAWDLRNTPGVGPKLSAAICGAAASDVVEAEWQRLRAAGVTLLFKGTPDYPARLAEFPDSPEVLFVRGGLIPADGLAVAIVGTRQCTPYGSQQAERLAGSLARAGVTIVSGLAKGIDGAAHRGALAAGGRTLAVLGTGVEDIYPPEHADLAVEVAGRGALLSETPAGRPALRGVFPQRNRIISGLSLGVIVVEAPRASGTMHTVRHALEQGREVFAVPGRVDSAASDGCHALLRDGATLVRNADDVLESLGPLGTPAPSAAPPVRVLPESRRLFPDDHPAPPPTPEMPVRQPRELLLNDLERHVLSLASEEPRHLDELVRTAGLDVSQVLQTVTILEMKRLLRRLPGGHVRRV